MGLPFLIYQILIALLLFYLELDYFMEVNGWRLVTVYESCCF